MILSINKEAGMETVRYWLHWVRCRKQRSMGVCIHRGIVRMSSRRHREMLERIEELGPYREI